LLSSDTFFLDILKPETTVAAFVERYVATACGDRYPRERKIIPSGLFQARTGEERIASISP
jgi:hypothetical protein